MKKTISVAVIGPSNAGKSTMINMFSGFNVSIVTPKPQTTRIRARGIAIFDDVQVIFVDTPGIFHTENMVGKVMVREAWNSLHEADIILFMIDALCHKHRIIPEILSNLKGERVALVINKVDKCHAKEILLPITEKMNSLFPFEETFMISVRRKDGINRIIDYLIRNAHDTEEWPYEAEQVSDTPMHFIVSEIVRKKAMMLLACELPYDIHIEHQFWEEAENLVTIHQNICVISESHRKILVGEKGDMIRRIGEYARFDIEKILEKKIMLKLFVKIAPRWKEDFIKDPLEACGILN